MLAARRLEKQLPGMAYFCWWRLSVAAAPLLRAKLRRPVFLCTITAYAGQLADRQTREKWRTPAGARTKPSVKRA